MREEPSGQRTEAGDRPLRIAGEAPGNRRPPAAELSDCRWRIEEGSRGESAIRSPESEIHSPLLGVTEYFPPGQPQRVAAGVKALTSLGLHHVRIEVAWAQWCDKSLREWYRWLVPALARQFTVLPALVYQPPPSEEAAGSRDAAVGEDKDATDHRLPTTDATAFADFLEEWMDHFPGVFDWMELPSGPAHPGLWDWRLDARGRVFSQILASAANRARQRGRKTVLGGLHTGDLGWLSLLCENGVMDFVDAVGLQEDRTIVGADFKPAPTPGRAIAHAPTPTPAPAWPEAMRETRRILGEHCRPAGLWITGAGCPTDNYDEFAQCETLMSLLDTGAERVYWSGLRDADRSVSPPRGPDAGARPRCLGLLRHDGTPKLLFRLWNSRGLEGVRQAVGWGRSSAEKAKVEIRNSRSPAKPGRRPVLITGGAGFIGSNLAERLLNLGRPVLILDNLSRAGVEHNGSFLCDTYGDLVEIYVGDVRSKSLVETLVARCESIFHLAAQVAVTTSLADPEGDFESNVQGTLNVLEAARRQDPQPPLLFTSTNKVYGDLGDIELIPVGERHVPRDHDTRACGIGETRPLAFHSPYGCSKGAADQYVLDYARMYGLPSVVFRMSCIYGRRQLGTEDQGWVAHFALQMLRDGILTVYGDGRQVRDILYIDDLLDAMFLAMKNIQAVAGQPFNIGGGPGNAVSLLEVIAQLAELSGVEPRIRYGPRRQGDQPYYVSDTRRFTRATGWTPQVSVARGVPRLYHWLLENVPPGVLGDQDRAPTPDLAGVGTHPDRAAARLGTLGIPHSEESGPVVLQPEE